MPATLLSNLDKNPPVNFNIEPSINATSDLSNDGGSSKRGVRYKIVIEKQKRHELCIVSYELLHDKLAVIYNCRGIFYRLLYKYNIL